MSIPHKQHLERVREAMRQWHVDLMFINYGPDMTYVTGLQTPKYYDSLKGKGDWVTGLLFGVDQDPVLVLQRSFAVGDMHDQTWIEDIRVLPEGQDPDGFLAKVVSDFQPSGKTIAVSKRVWGQTLLSLQAAAPGARFVSATDAMMDQVRSIKDDYELALLARCAEITDVVLAETLKHLKPGITERDVATEVVHQIPLAGGDTFSFYPGIICVGNGSDPDRHIMTRNTEMVLDHGTTVAFDFGVLYQGYCSDFGRSAFVGEPREDALGAYRCITAGAQEVMEQMGDGKITPIGTHKYMWGLTREAGYEEWYYKWGLGHGIGLDVHEDPWLREGFDEPIRAGMVFTVEPKIWKPGVFYVRCEDVVVVGEDRATSLTKHHYEPNIID